MRARWIGPVAMVGMLLVGSCSSGRSDGDASGPTDGPAVTPADEGIDGVVAIRIGSADHVDGEVDYDREPPAGGDHNPVPARCGFYAEVVPPEFVVHSLEHGALWLAYPPTLAASEVEVLRAITRANPETIASVDEDLEDGVAVVATAWARQLTLPSVEDPRLEEFVARYQDGDQSPEAGVPCAGQGAGQPEP